LKKAAKKVLTNHFFGVIITGTKAMTKKAEVQSFQRGGVWCEPSTEHFKATPSEQKLRKLSVQVDSFRKRCVKV
jgi:hypothetical protein